MKYFFIIFLFLTIKLFSQSKTELSFFQQINDTIDKSHPNKVDALNNKQGWWIITGKMEKTVGYKADQIISEGPYRDNKKTGVWLEYFDNGKIKMKATYVNGDPNGYVKLYYENGNLKEEGIWRDYKWQGEYRMYYESGSIKYRFHFKRNGAREDSQYYFWENGNLMIEGTWENGQEAGKITEYYDNGSIRCIKTFYAGGILNEEKSKNYPKKEILKFKF